MKKFTFGILILGALCIASCEDDSDDPTPTNNSVNNQGSTNSFIESTPSAKVENDNVSAGIYKGTIVGSTGTFKLIINSNEISGILILDGISHILSTTDISSSDLNSAIRNAKFQNADGTITLTFSVDADGNNPKVKVTANGHEGAKAKVLKETSNSLVRVYEGFRFFSEKITKWKNPGVSIDTLITGNEKIRINLVLRGDTGSTNYLDKIIEFNRNGITLPPSLFDSVFISPLHKYSIKGDKINMYRIEQLCDTCFIKEYFLDSTNTSFSNNEIIRMTEENPNDYTNYKDSTHLIRKL